MIYGGVPLGVLGSDCCRGFVLGIYQSPAVARIGFNWKLSSVLHSSFNMTSEPAFCWVCNEYKRDCFPSTDLLKFVVYGIIVSSTSVVGIILNVVSIYIMSQKQMKKSLNEILISPEVFDTILLSSTLLADGIPTICEYYGIWENFYLHELAKSRRFIYPLVSIARLGSAYTTVLITIERYIAVCHPLKVRYLFTTSRTRLHIILLTAVVVLYNIPNFLKFSVEPLINVDTNMTYGYTQCETEFSKAFFYKTVYNSWLYMIILLLTPFCSLLVLNGLIYRSVLIASRNRQSMSNQTMTNLKAIPLLFAVVLVYMICNFLALICILMFLLKSNEIRDISDNTYRTAIIISNSACNVFLYCYFNKEFRDLFLCKLFKLMRYVKCCTNN